MKHLISWRLGLILAVAVAGGCRTPPPVPKDPPRPREPDLEKVEIIQPLSASPHLLAENQSIIAGQPSANHGQAYTFDPNRGLIVPRVDQQLLSVRPLQAQPLSPEMFPMSNGKPIISIKGKSYECDPTLGELVPSEGQPCYPLGSPGETVKPQLEYKPLAYSAPK